MSTTRQRAIAGSPHRSALNAIQQLLSVTQLFCILNNLGQTSLAGLKMLDSDDGGNRVNNHKQESKRDEREGGHRPNKTNSQQPQINKNMK